MLIAKIIIVLLLISNKYLGNVKCSTHFLVNDGIIQPHLTSPFYLRQPNDLLAFLNQSNYVKLLDKIMEELIVIKQNLTSKMDVLDKYTNELTSKINCIPNFYLDEHDLFSTITNKNYLYRLNYKYLLSKDINVNANAKLPKCSEMFLLDFSMCCFEHLQSMKNRKNLKMEAEKSLGLEELGISTQDFPILLSNALKNNPNSWKLYSLSSYYWRYMGNAFEAIECARRAVYLSPRKFKDISLLSFGTILQRTNNINDSVIVLKAAVDHNDKIAENVLALANSLMLQSDFNRSLKFYKLASNIDSSYADKIDYIKKSIFCFRDLKINLIIMENLLDEIIPGLKRYSILKKEFEDIHTRLGRNLAPLATRIFDEKYENSKEILVQRSQICSSRQHTESGESVLVCDFISDIQIRFFQDFAIDILNNYVDLKKELINTYKINSLGIYKKIFVETFSIEKY